MSQTALVVDDSHTMRNMVMLTMQESDFDVVAAEDGKEALDLLEGNDFDIIITDINMPNVNGIELIQKLRNIEKYKFTPVLVLTTEGGEDMKVKGKDAGATGWIVKPFNPEVLMHTINRVLG